MLMGLQIIRAQKFIQLGTDCLSACGQRLCLVLSNNLGREVLDLNLTERRYKEPIFSK